MNCMKPFSGKWICAEEFAACRPINLLHREHEFFVPPFHEENLKNYHMTVTGSFSGSFGGSDVRMRITADDYYKLWINGHFVGQGPAPGYFYDYYYNEFDIAPFLADGENRITVQVYYQGLVNRVWCSGDRRQGMIADVLADGKPVYCTDESWSYVRERCYTGMRTTGYETNYLEDVDSRIAPDAPKPVSVREDADYTFREEPIPALQVYDIDPVQSEERGDTVFLDFGAEHAGTLLLDAEGRDGDSITIRCGEELNADGSVRWQMHCNCDYQEFWTLKEGRNHLEQYDYKGFRYAELVCGGKARVQKVQMRVRHYPYPENAAILESANKVLEQVFAVCRSGVVCGTQESFLDCPTREKGQYTGDLTVTGASQLLLTADPAMLRRAIELEADTLRFCPGMLAVAPGSFMQEIADYSLQFPLSVWRYYQYTGDRDFLSRMYPACLAIQQYFEAFAREDGLLTHAREKWNLVDWPANLRDGYEGDDRGCHNVLNAFYVGCVYMNEAIGDELGIPHEKKADALREAFNRAFFDEEQGLYTDCESSSHTSLHANCIPAFYGLVPEGYEQKVGDFLAGRGLVCGVYMAYFLLKALARMGRYSDVWAYLVSEAPNSWYNMVREGATTCLEAWGGDQKWNTSHCHPWASAPVSVLIEDIAGLRPAKPGEGWSFHPHFPRGIGRLRLRVPTPEGDKELRIV